MYRSYFLTGRSDKNRTCDLLNPIQARYQTALHPDRSLTWKIIAHNFYECNSKTDVFAFFIKKDLSNDLRYAKMIYAT